MEEIGKDRGSERTMKKLKVRVGSIDLSKGWEMIGQGAEARVYRGTLDGRKAVAKQRFVKTYRHPLLDVQLTRERLRAEARCLVRCRSAGVPVPEVLLADLDNRTLVMEEVNGTTLRQHVKQLESQSGEEVHAELLRLATSLGQLIGKLHDKGMVHGDPTTSNIMLTEEGLVMLDLGLGSCEAGLEEKAVDLYVLERAISSSHPNFAPLIPRVISEYTQTLSSGGKAEMSRLEEVRARGRKRSMVG